MNQITEYRNDLGELHCETGPAVIWANQGIQEWYQNGLRHREDGPAYISHTKLRAWYFNNMRHRLDGPAIEWPNGDKDYYINDIQYSEEEYKFIKFCYGR